MASGSPARPRLDDRGDISVHEEAVCPSCGEPLIGAESGTLRVVRETAERFRRLVLISNGDGAFVVIANEVGEPESRRESVYAECAACGQVIDARVAWGD